MSRALKYDIPGPDWRVDPDQVRSRGWQAIFGSEPGSARPLVVEIGFGRGEFLLDLARRASGTAHLGVEYSGKRVLKTARRLARTELCNVRLVQATGECVVQELLPTASVAGFWINFPDPWPKKRHHKRRLVNPAFVHAVAASLVPGGRLHVATDHPDYAEVIHETLSGEALLENLAAPAAFLREVTGRLRTAYELEWRAEGRPLHFFEYRRRCGPRTQRETVHREAARGEPLAAVSGELRQVERTEA